MVNSPREVSPVEDRRCMVGRICEKGRFKPEVKE